MTGSTKVDGSEGSTGMVVGIGVNMTGSNKLDGSEGSTDIVEDIRVNMFDSSKLDVSLDVTQLLHFISSLREKLIGWVADMHLR